MTYNNYGIIATETGVDVQGSPDYRQILNSNWPVMEIASEKYFSSEPVATIAFGIFRQVISTHNLGFKPAYTYVDVSGYSSFGNGYPTNVGFDSFSIEVDEKYAYITGFSGVAGSFTFSGLLRIYNYNPATEFKAPFYQPSDPKNAVGSYGVAALTNAFDGDISGSDFSKFSINSRAKSLTIHQSGVADATPGYFTITHNLGYLPSYMIFRENNRALQTPLSDQVAARTFGNQNTLTFNGVQSVLNGKYDYIIFKDPVMQQQI